MPGRACRRQGRSSRWPPRPATSRPVPRRAGPMVPRPGSGRCRVRTCARPRRRSSASCRSPAPSGAAGARGRRGHDRPDGRAAGRHRRRGRPSGYRVAGAPAATTARPSTCCAATSTRSTRPATVRPGWVKVQAAGPWTLVASVELHTGHKVLTDRGAVREFAASLDRGAAGARRGGRRAHRGAAVLLQLDEPSLAAVIGGQVGTPSGYGTVRAVSEAAAKTVLRDLITAVGVPVVLHCCASRPPMALLADVGAAGDRGRRDPSGGRGRHRRPGGAGSHRRDLGRRHPAAAGPGAATAPRGAGHRAAGSPGPRSTWPTASASIAPVSAPCRSRPPPAVWPEPTPPGPGGPWSCPASWARPSWTRPTPTPMTPIVSATGADPGGRSTG